MVPSSTRRCSGPASASRPPPMNESPFTQEGTFPHRGVSRRVGSVVRRENLIVRLFPEAETRGEGLPGPVQFRADRLRDRLVVEPMCGAGHADRAHHLAGVVADGGADAPQPLLELLEVGGITQFPDEHDLLYQSLDIGPGGLPTPREVARSP